MSVSHLVMTNRRLCLHR